MLCKRAWASPWRNSARCHGYIEASLHFEENLLRTTPWAANQDVKFASRINLQYFSRSARTFLNHSSQALHIKRKKGIEKPSSRHRPIALCAPSCLQTSQSSQKHSKTTPMSSELSAATKIWNSERRVAKKSSARRRSTKLPPPRIKTVAACLSFST